MSEYQYYEFAAVDQSLTPQQQAELRRRSSRATITPTSFINEYHWGDLKGNPLDWMRNYFDAHVYSANWGSCCLMLRVPLETLDANVLAEFTRSSVSETTSGFADAFTATASAQHWILTWSFNDDSGDFERFYSQADGPGWLTQLLPLRDELQRGDLRSLYLGWLVRVGSGDLGDDDEEPPVPAGLGTLSPAQQALAEFLMLDPDWLNAASANSPHLPSPGVDEPDFDAWLNEQPEAAMRTILRLLLEGRRLEAERNVRQTYLAWRRPRQIATPQTVRRHVGQIKVGVSAASDWRLERERQAQETEEAKRQTERLVHLKDLAQNAQRVWQEIDSMLERATGSSYDQALLVTKELSEALKLTGHEAEFQCKFSELLKSHGHRPAWVKRLEKAGLIRRANT